MQAELEADPQLGPGLTHALFNEWLHIHNDSRGAVVIAGLLRDGDVAYLGARRVRATELLSALETLPIDVLLSTADEEYADAAAVCERIGSHPLAANAHMLATRQAAQEGRDGDARRHAVAVLAFAERSGAALYPERATELVKAV